MLRETLLFPRSEGQQKLIQRRVRISENAETISEKTETKKARVTPRSSQSSRRLSRHLRMVENVGYALGAIACSLAYQAIYIALADGVVKFA